jgi:hypothetical protein
LSFSKCCAHPTIWYEKITCCRECIGLHPEKGGIGSQTCVENARIRRDRMRLQPAEITRNGIQNLDLENEGGRCYKILAFALRQCPKSDFLSIDSGR